MLEFLHYWLPLPIESLLLLFSAAVLAGWVDAIGGGGGLITIPIFLAVGIPPVQALATNKLQSSFGSFTATLNFIRSGLLKPRQHLFSVACTFVGAVLGALLLQRIDSGFLARLIPILLIAFAVYFIFAPRLSDDDRHQRLSEIAFALTIGLSVGFYDGFFGPGTGSFFALACVLLLGMGIKRATATTKLLNFTSNIASLMVFITFGQVLWGLGLLMGFGQILGSYVGSHMAIKHGSRLIRPVLVTVTLLISLKLLST